MEALLLLLTGVGIVITLVWLALCGVIDLAALGTAVVQYVKEEIER